jgi:hypothetical protein
MTQAAENTERTAAVNGVAGRPRVVAYSLA